MTHYTRYPAGEAPAVPLRGRHDRTPAKPRPAAKAGAGSRGATAARSAGNGRLSPLVVLFILSVFVPTYFSVGGLALSPSRVMMVLLAIPVFAMFAAGKAGRVRTADIFAFLYTFWFSVAILAYGGLGQVEFIGISAIEILTPYLLARCAIRSRADYNAFLRFMLLLIAGMAVVAAIEATTGLRLVNRLFDMVGRTYPPTPETYERRLGMLRAQAVFEHPILFGVVMALFFSPIVFMPGRDGKPGPRIRAAAPLLATFFSLSTGAWLSVVVQIGLISWDRIFNAVKARWKVLMALTVIGYITVDILSNRTPFEVFISYATLNQSTSYWRVLIFIHGMENVWANPLFGIGLGDWARPSWMYSPSVDNFWLLQAMRYGIPGFLLMTAMYLSVVIGLARVRIADKGLRLQRNAFVYALVGLALSLGTVHVWGTAFYVVTFILGSMSWLHDADTETGPAGGPDRDGSDAAQDGRAGRTRRAPRGAAGSGDRTATAASPDRAGPPRERASGNRR